jgi:UDP-galactopyranose mutase
VLSSSSWDTTQARMAGLVADVMGLRTGATSPALLVAAE